MNALMNKRGGRGFYRRYGKRALDLTLALILFLPAGIIIALCCILIKHETKGPAFFVQDRPGHLGKCFKMIKLRTMIPETERDGRTLSDMERVTKAGRIIRACSFDELPQILNIIAGEMSFIGPRPLLPSYLAFYSEKQMRRHVVRPGISGWAQINGRNGIGWEQKFDQDVWYVDHLDFKLDFFIFRMTIINVLRRRGINASASDTMRPFGGELQTWRI